MQKLKRPVSVILSILMVVSMFVVVPFTASAATTTVDVATEEDFVAAVNNADVGTINITGDFSLNQVVTFTANKTVNFNDKTVTVTKNRAIVVDTGKTVSFKGTTGGLYTNGDVGFILNKGTLNVYSGVYNALNMTTGGLSVVKNEPGAWFNMQGGEINSKYYGIYTHGENSRVWIQNTAKVHSVDAAAISGNGLAANAGYYIYINGGTITSDNSSAIYHPNIGTLQISPYKSQITIQGATGIYTKAGTTKITANKVSPSLLKIIGTGAKADYAYNGDGNTPTGDAFVIDNCNYPGSVPTVDIKFGTFESTNGSAIASYVGQDDPNYTGADQEAVENFISVGYEGYEPVFSTSVSEDYFAEGFKPVDNGDGTYTVAPKDYVAQIGDNKYETLEAAFAAAQDGNTITVLKDCSIDAQVTIPANTAVTIDFADKKVTVTTPWDFANKGTLTVTGSTGGLTGVKGLIDNYGTLNVAGGVYTATAGGDSAAIWNNGNTKMNVTGGTITADCYGIYVGSGDELTVSGGSITSVNQAAISGNGSTGQGGYTINITGGEVASTNEVAIYHPNAGTLNITGGTITGPTAIYVKSGTTAVGETNISGATIITGTGAAADFVHNGDGCNPTGDAIVIENCGYPGGIPAIGISGGTISSTNAKAVASYAYGTTATGAAYEPITGFVSGGTFNTPVPEEYCAANFIPKDNGNGTYGVKQGSYVAQVGDTKYEDLQTALNAAQADDEIVVLDNIALTGAHWFVVNKDVTIDLNGKTISSEDSVFVTKNGADLTVKNGTMTSSVANDYAIYVNDGSVFTLEDDATLKATNSRGNGIIVRTGGQADINGTIETGYYSIAGFGTSVVNVNDGASITSTDASAISGNGSGGNEGYTFNVKGGTLTSTNDVAIYHPNQGTLNITGGTITGKTAVYIKSGTTDVSTSSTSISGATIHGTGADTAMVHSGNGCNATGDAIVIENCGYPGGTPSVEISGGTIKSDNADAVASYGYDDGTTEYEPIKEFVSGGSFSNVVPADYCAKGYSPVTIPDSNNMYTVEETKAVEAYDANGDLVGAYVTINDAIEAGGDGCTVKLVSDLYKQQQINSQKTPVTLDLNGHMIDVEDGAGLNFGMGYYWTGDHIFTVKDTVGTGGINITPKYPGNACISDNNGRTIIVEGGTFTSTGKAIYCTGSNGSITVNGGTFNGDVYVHDTGYGHGELSITGGTVNGTLSTVDNAVLKVSGGVFNAPVPEAYCAQGYTPKDNGDGTYTVTKKLFVGHNLLLGGDIGVNFYLNPEILDSYNGTKTVKFTCDGEETTVNVPATPTDNGYKVTLNVVAARMAHKIKAVVYVDGTALDQTDSYSVQDYAEAVYKNPETYTTSAKAPALKALAKAMLNYGSEAQTVFATSLTEHPDRADKTVGKTSYTNVTAAAVKAKINGSASNLETVAEQLNAKYYTNSLIYLQNNTLRVYFTPKTYPSTMPNAGAYDGNLSNYYYYKDVEGIAAAELDDQKEFKVGNVTFKYSALNYVVNVLNSGDKMNDAQKDLAKSVFLYNQAANAYFG